MADKRKKNTGKASASTQAGQKKRVLHFVAPGSPKGALHSSFVPAEWEEIFIAPQPVEGAAMVAEMTDLPAVEDASVEAIWAAHNLKNLYTHQVPRALQECRRVLKEGGFILVTVPDIQAVADKIVKGVWEDPLYRSKAGPVTVLDILYGFRPHLEGGLAAAAHKTGFTAAALGRALKNAGFTNIRVRRHEMELTAQGWKIDALSAKRDDRIVILDPSATPTPPPGKLPDDLDMPPQQWEQDKKSA